MRFSIGNGRPSSQSVFVPEQSELTDRCLVAPSVRRTDSQVCAPGHSQDDPDLAAVARVLKVYFAEHGLLAGERAPRAPQELTRYWQYLTALRGLAPGTIADDIATVSEFLQIHRRQAVGHDPLAADAA